MLIRRLINLDTGERYTVFCAEHLVDFETETGSGDADVTNNNRMSEIVLKITTTSGSIKVD